MYRFFTSTIYSSHNFEEFSTLVGFYFTVGNKAFIEL